MSIILSSEFQTSGKPVRYNTTLLPVFLKMITYRDWTGHVISEEERDIYVAEMENKQSNEGHLLRVVLEQVIRIPPVTPTSLEGCAYIHVSYRIGVIHLKLKRLTHIWTPNEWQVLGDKRPKLVNRVIERLYVINPSTPSLRWTRAPIALAYNKLKTKHIQKQDVYRELQLSIPLIIGTAHSSTTSAGSSCVSHCTGK